MVTRHGRVAAQAWWAPYRPGAPHRLYSLSKSFTSTAVGFAVAEGKLRVSDRVVDFFPGQLPPQVSDNLAAMRVENLLTMSSGHAKDPTPQVTREQDWIHTFLSLPVELPPGSRYVYNSAATYMLSAIVQTVVGEKLVDFLRPRFFDPLGLPPMHWATCPRGINTGGWGLSATTWTLSRFGQFYLQKGRWNGRQLLPRSWVEQATRSHIQQPAGPGQTLAQLEKSSDWHQGYGYQFLRCRHRAYRADGAFGQWCIVLPELDAVIAITSLTPNTQGLLDLVWDHLLPGLQNAAHEDAASDDRLGADLAALTLPVPRGTGTTPGRALPTEYVVEPNSLGVQSVSLRFNAQSCRLVFTTAQKDYPITCGIGQWLDGETDFPGTPPEITELVGVDPNPRRPDKLAAAGAWKDADTFQMQWRYYETPNFDTVTCRFVAAGIEISFLNSITQLAPVHPESRPMLKGRVRS